ncbi:trp operon leader peptide [Streptomyces lusitanus]|uniref:trp operon leader peptide n=1 Tax=Streptomyces lusitanus TaxID=68232 RepID=UPI003609FCCA
MSPGRRRSENQRSRSRAPHYAVAPGAFRLAQPLRRPRPASCTVPAMFAHSTRTWWWTAHPAAH